MSEDNCDCTTWYFMDCTCEHTSEQHGFGHCNVDGCLCDGGWEE